MKQGLTRQLIRDAGRKAASVRSLRRTSVPIISGGGTRAAIPPSPILAGILAMRSAWDESFQKQIADVLSKLPPQDRLDFGCALQHGAFEWTLNSGLHFSAPDEAPIFFVIRLIVRLRALGTAPAAD